MPGEKEPSGPPGPATDRRRLLRAGVLAGAATLAGARAVEESMAAPRSGAKVPSFELDEVGIAELQRRMEAGELTARALARKYLARVEAIDRKGPALRSVIELNPDALAIAAALDRERKAKGPRGPLHGIPVLIKDNLDTKDRMATTAGSLALVGAKPPADAFVVQRLRQAGAVILGKTNLSEWANIRSTRSTSGWSGRGGLTCNPYALDRNTSGSSSGSGAAVAANLCAAAVGTETDGSIVSPSSANGIVGIKPTVGLLSRTGIIPISHTQDSAGPMARSVRDAAILLGVMAGVDPEDAATQRTERSDGVVERWSNGGAGPSGSQHSPPASRAPAPPLHHSAASSLQHSAPDYTRFLDAKGLRGARVGVVRRYWGTHRAVDGVADAALAALKEAGATLVDPVELPTLDQAGENEMTVLLYELKAGLNAYLARLGPGAPVRSLKEIVAFNERHREREMPYFGQEQFLKAEEKGLLTSKEYVEALEKQRRLARDEGIDAVMERHRLEALVAPTSGPAWLIDLVNGDHFVLESSTAAAIAGYPSITVPAGFVHGLPVGLSFFGRAWSEPALLRLAYAFEQATNARRPPRFLPAAELRSTSGG